MIVRKRPLTMLELLISMTLTVLILSTLTYFYHQMTMAGIVLDKKQGENFQKRYVEHRLGTVIPHTIPATKENSHFHFFTSQAANSISMSGTQSLVFVFDNCVQSNKEMAYHVIGRLLLNQNGQLLLVTWPSEKRWVENESIPHSYEILMEGVKDLEFSFFVPPIKGKTDLKAGKPRTVQKQDPLEGMRGEWVTEWRPDWRQLPAMMRLTVTISEEERDKKLNFAFPFPYVEQPITYDS